MTLQENNVDISLFESTTGYKAIVGIYDFHISLIIPFPHFFFLQPTPPLAWFPCLSFWSKPSFHRNHTLEILSPSYCVLFHLMDMDGPEPILGSSYTSLCPHYAVANVFPLESQAISPKPLECFCLSCSGNSSPKLSGSNLNFNSIELLEQLQGKHSSLDIFKPVQEECRVVYIRNKYCD